jgi:hypothetical protein
VRRNTIKSFTFPANLKYRGVNNACGARTNQGGKKAHQICQMIEEESGYKYYIRGERRI